LEITESAVIQNAEATINTLRNLKALGVRLAIDDFGTGYSSLSYLQRLSVDTLKIDRSFIGELRREQSSQAIVQAVVAMAHTLEIDVTAEGIETADQLGLVRVLRCDYGQGFFLFQPVPAEQFESLLLLPA
jgi:EAL domain-containing protein (putative c-di-GMP-specific phosphodiesterase class I)